MTQTTHLMEFAAEIARQAGRSVLDRYGEVAVERKADGTEVTEADRESERVLREAILGRFPSDGILGEEEGERTGSSGNRWVLDPIDGTRSFTSGVPLFGVLVGYEVDGAPLVGCAHFPAIGETYVAGLGEGCFKDGVRIEAQDRATLEGVRLITSGLEYWRDAADAAPRAGFDRIAERASFVRTWGDAFGYVSVAAGRADLLVDPFPGAWWDIIPLVPILSEAGVRFGRPDGGAAEPGHPVIAAPPRLYTEAARLLSAD